MTNPARVKPPVERLAYNVSEAATALGIGRPTTYRMINDKQLVTFTVRGMRRMSVAEISRLKSPSSPTK